LSREVVDPARPPADGKAGPERPACDPEVISMGTSDNLPREPDRRASGGIEVCLWWSPADGRTWVCVDDVRSGALFVLPVADQNRARDVFDHPYAYATRRSVHPARAA
jgi:hypothetical protein